MLGAVFKIGVFDRADILRGEQSGEILSKAERDKVATNDMNKKLSLPEVLINQSFISLYSWADMQNITVVNVDKLTLEGSGSVWDPRMGPSSPYEVCSYCGEYDCPGHYGLIRLRRYVYNPAFIRTVISVLRCVCNNCGKILMEESIMKEQGILQHKHDKRLTLLEKECKKIKCTRGTDCPPNPTYLTEGVEKEGLIKRATKDKKKNEEGKKEKDPGIEIPIDDVFRILNRISTSDTNLLGFTESNSDIIIRVINDILFVSISMLELFNRDTTKMIIQSITETIPELIDLKTFRNEIKRVLDVNLMNIFINTANNIEDLIIKEVDDFAKVISKQTVSLEQVPKIIKTEINRIMRLIKPLIENMNLFVPEKNINDNVSKLIDRDHRIEVKNIILVVLLQNIDNLYNDILAKVKLEYRIKTKKVDSLLRVSHPRDLLISGVIVTSRISRPRMYRNGQYYHDSLTQLYVNILRRLERLTNLEKPPITFNRLEEIRKAKLGLYTSIKELIYERKRETVKKSDKVDPLSVFQRIQGKNALIRHAMMGKIVEYCGRTVAGPDPSLKFGQIRIPELWRSILTKKITVTSFNIDHLKGLYEAGRITHIIPLRTGILTKVLDQKDIANSKYTLNIGDKVHRWLENGDRVVVNRQPTLHRQSMMKYEVVLGKQLTIGLHLSYTTPMNADFDGDEINTWNPQDFEVEAETEIIMDVKKNIMSSEQNRPMMGLVMNSISGAYLSTVTDVTINKDLFAELLTFVTDQENIRTLHARLIKYGVNPYSGKAIFSAMLPKDFYYNQKGVVILEGILVSGKLKKSTVGASHRSIIQDLYKKYGPEVTSNFFTDAPWILNKWIMERGFSVGLLDMVNLIVDEKKGIELDRNVVVLKEELANIYNQLQTLAGKYEDPIEERFRQQQIINISNVANGIGIRLADNVLSKDNSIGVMTEKGAGTKGAVANIAQMMGAVGQQFLYGQRLPQTITKGRRALPVYDEDDQNPEAYGFIPQSFFQGLTPSGLFFLMAGGRQSLLETALSTAQSGNLQHLMLKAFENVVISYDGSIRNTVGYMFAPMYNSGYDIGEMMMVDNPGKTDFTSFVDIKNLVNELNVKRGWVPKEVNYAVSQNRVKNNNIKNDDLPQNKLDKRIIVEDYEPVKVNKLNKFELSRTIGSRAKEISNGSLPLVNIGNELDVVKIAMMEYDNGILPNMKIVRKYDKGHHEIIDAI